MIPIRPGRSDFYLLRKGRALLRGSDLHPRRPGGGVGVCMGKSSNMEDCLNRHMDPCMHEAAGATTPKDKRKARSNELSISI